MRPDNYSDGNNIEKVAGFQVLENPCVWMRAGVVNFRICENRYDCVNCDFDRSMRRAMTAQAPPKGRAAQLGWAREMRLKYTGVFKPCRYFLTGKLGPPGRCERDYDCDGCPIDMMLGYQPLTTAITEAESALKVEVRPEIRNSEHSGKECIWMRAGVVNFHLCESDYDCYHCLFDRNMREAMTAQSPSQVEATSLSWEDRIQSRFETLGNECIYFMAGRIDTPKVCLQNYACFSCPVHQKLADPNRVAPIPLHPPSVQMSSGFRVADGYYYHYGHSWVHVIHGGCVRIGIDDFMAKVFGRAKRIDLPPNDTPLKQGHVGWVLARNGHRAPVQSPLSGKVLAVNRKVLDDPGQIHEDPYENGWLFHLEPSFLRQESQMLYSGKTSRQWIEREHQGLLQLMGPEYERLAATGAETIGDLFGACPELGWTRLVQQFLRTGEKK